MAGTPVATPHHALGVLLLFCCGLRRGSCSSYACRHRHRRQVLRIDRTKFHKSRLVPLSPSVNGNCESICDRRCDPQDTDGPFGTVNLEWTVKPGRAARSHDWPEVQLVSNLSLRWCLNYRGRPPRIHDLRHSFAVTVLQHAYETGSDPQATLPRLARYMGHLRFQFTHHYLQLTEPLRLAANDRFRRFLPANCSRPPAHPAQRRCPMNNVGFSTLAMALRAFLGEYLPHQKLTASTPFLVIATV